METLCLTYGYYLTRNTQYLFTFNCIHMVEAYKGKKQCPMTSLMVIRYGLGITKMNPLECIHVIYSQSLSNENEAVYLKLRFPFLSVRTTSRTFEYRLELIKVVYIASRMFPKCFKSKPDYFTV